VRGAALFRNIGDLARLHRQVTNMAAVGGWGAALLLCAAAFVTGNQRFAIEAIGPAVAGAVSTVLVATRRHNAVAVFSTAIFTITVTYHLVGDAETLIPAAVSLTLVGVLGTLFVDKGQPQYVAAGTVWMLATAALWLGDLWASTGLTMAVSFMVGSVILVLVRQSAVEAQRRYQQMFELAPIGLMEQDWTAAVRMAAVVHSESREELAARLRRDPEFVRLLIEAVEVTRVNTEAGSIAGVPPSQLTNPLPLSQLLPADTEVWIEQIAAVAHEDEGYYTEHPTRQFTGEEIYVGIRSISIERSRNSTRRLVAIDDITEQRVAEQATAELVKAKDRFIASVSHELRTPLAAIVGFAAEMAHGGIDADDRGEIADLIHEQATQMSNIVEDLLVAARADAGSITVRTEPFDPSALVEWVIGQHSKPGIRADLEPDLLANADPLRTTQILRNLLSNAERYGRPPIEARCYRSGRQVVIDVHDHGDPLSEADRERIFQPYVRAHGDPTGLTAAVGLGLAVSHQLAELMGGTLTHHSEDGTVFRLTLPLYPAQGCEETPALRQAAAV
jgi:signal transduction histidine kinase